MKNEIKVPEVGESITEGVLVSWSKNSGEAVAVDDELFELETDKITLTVAAEQAGVLHVDVKAGATVEIGQVVGHIDSEGVATQAEVEPPLAPTAGAQMLAHNIESTQRGDLDGLSPAVRRVVVEKGLDPAGIAASGRGGRLTKGDVLAHLAEPAKPQAGDSTTGSDGGAALAKKPGTAREPGPRQTRTPMTRLRARIAERLVAAQQTAAILTTFNEVDMSAVLDLRARFKERFKQNHDVGLGFMSFFIKATVDALKAVPALNAQIQGDEIVHNHYYDIGVAVGTPRGLVVPVLRDCDQLSFAQIEVGIADLAARARAGKLELSDLSGGVFTISNGGVYGSLLSTPILNPPQSGILGMHGIKKRPVVVDDAIVIRPMMYLAVSYDHRLVDGTEAVIFLKHIVEGVEQPARALLEI